MNIIQCIQYILYVRKSSEDEGRQIASIDAQIAELKKLAESLGLKIVKVLQESQSAKEPGRPVFNSMLESLYKGEAQGIICWKLDRLARNPVDGGNINWMLQQGIIQHIQTYDRSYYPSDNTLMMSFEFGMANQFVRDLSVNVKRGLRKKYDMGYPANLSKIGYSNDKGGDKGQKKIYNDLEKQPLLTMVYEKFLSGGYSISRIRDYSEKIGLRTMQRKKEGGRPLSKSAMYNLLKDPFYAGFFFAKDESGKKKRYKANESLNRIITEDQYWRIQMMLGKKGKPCPTKYPDIFPYKRFMKSCDGRSITAEQKWQLICPDCKLKFSYRNKTHCPKCGVKIENMSKPKYLYYSFYHPIINKKHPKGKSIQEKEINDYMHNWAIKNIKISPDLRDWCLKNFTEIIKKEEYNELESRMAHERTLEEKRKNYDSLIKMNAKGLISDEEAFIRAEREALAEIKKTEGMIGHNKPSQKEETAKAERFFNLAERIGDIFIDGTPEDKEGALSEICSNLTLENKKLEFCEQNKYSILRKCILKSKAKSKHFEPTKYTINTRGNKGKTESFDSVRPTWLPLCDTLRTLKWEQIMVEIKNLTAIPV